MRLSPKYFKIRTAVATCTTATLALTIACCFFIRAYLSDQSERKTDTAWQTLAILLLAALFGFLSYIAWKSYQEFFLKGDKIMWQVSKWKVIKRWLLEPRR